MPTPWSARSLTALTLLMLAAACEDGGTEPDAESEDPDDSAGELVYSTFDPATGRWGVAVADADGSNPRALPFPAENPGGLPDMVFFELQWSPDGRSLLHRSSRTNTDDWALALIDADGTRKRFLTHPNGFALRGRWSPRGDRVLYDRGGLLGDRFGVAYQTSIVDTLGVSTDFFVQGDGQLFQGERVHFSTLAIADSTAWETVPAVYVADFLNGDELAVLGAIGRPLWSGDLPESALELFRVSATTGEVLERLTRNTVSEHGIDGFSISPDGSTVLLARSLVTGSDDYRDFRLFTMPLAGGGPLVRITDGPHESGYRWASDSRHVTYGRPAQGVVELWAVDARTAGSERRLLRDVGYQADLFLR